jgi:flagellar basal body-associated protein FliL
MSQKTTESPEEGKETMKKEIEETTEKPAVEVKVDK